MEKLLEKHIQKQILDYLKIKGVFHWRNNSGAMKKGDHYMYFGAKGSPDIFAIKNGTLWGIEVKRGKAKLSEFQEQFSKGMVENGAKFIVARSLDDVMEIL